MKGVNLPTALISVMVGVLLVFTVVIPIAYNGTYGTLYEGDTASNSSVIGATVTNYTVDDCTPVRADTTWVTALDGTTDVSDQVSVADAMNGIYTLTNTSVNTATSLEMDYRCYDSGYISDSTARTVSGFIPVLVVVLIIVGLAGMMYFRK